MQKIDDATWAALDPDAGVFTRRQRVRASLAVIAAALVTVVIWIIWWSGVLSPRLVLEPAEVGLAQFSNGKIRTFEYGVMLRNPAPRAVTIRSVGRSGPGLRLLSVRGDDSLLRGSSSELVVLTYGVFDCGAVPTGEWPIPVTIERRGGPDVRLLPAPPIDPFWLDESGVDSSEVDDSSIGDSSLDLGDQPWQAALAERVCSSSDRATNQ